MSVNVIHFAGPLLNHVADEGEAHLIELSKLAEKDPEFYKYLQENDQELLDFKLGENGAEEDGEDDEEAMEEDETPVLTKEILRHWQKALLNVRIICLSEVRQRLTRGYSIAP